MGDLCDPSNRKKLRAKIKGVMDYAIRDKLENYGRQLNKISSIFDEIGFKFSGKTFSFFDDEGKKFTMQELSSRRFLRQYKQINKETEMQLARYANHLVQNRFVILQYGERTGGIKAVMERMETACQRRTEFIDAHGKLMNELVGKYQSTHDNNAVYFISTDPYQIFTKSTGRTWSPKNCERIDGDSSHGIDSDIAHNSAVLYILDNRKKGFSSAIARMELRLCVFNEKAKVKKEKYSIGWDINWYRGNHSHDRYPATSTKKFDNLDLSAKQALAEVIKIIHDHGFNTSYDLCITPFAHEGFSDIESTSRTAIAYQSTWPYTCNVCDVSTKKEFYERYGGKCHFCWKTEQESNSRDD